MKTAWKVKESNVKLLFLIDSQILCTELGANRKFHKKKQNISFAYYADYADVA